MDDRPDRVGERFLNPLPDEASRLSGKNIPEFICQLMYYRLGHKVTPFDILNTTLTLITFLPELYQVYEITFGRDALEEFEKRCKEHCTFLPCFKEDVEATKNEGHASLTKNSENITNQTSSFHRQTHPVRTRKKAEIATQATSHAENMGKPSEDCLTEETSTAKGKCISLNSSPLDFWHFPSKVFESEMEKFFVFKTVQELKSNSTVEELHLKESLGLQYVALLVSPKTVVLWFTLFAALFFEILFMTTVFLINFIWLLRWLNFILGALVCSLWYSKRWDFYSKIQVGACLLILIILIATDLCHKTNATNITKVETQTAIAVWMIFPVLLSFTPFVFQFLRFLGIGPLKSVEIENPDTVLESGSAVTVLESIRWFIWDDPFSAVWFWLLFFGGIDCVWLWLYSSLPQSDYLGRQLA